MRDVFEKYHLVVKSNSVEEYQVLMNLPHVPHVRNEREVKLFREETDGEELAHTGQPRNIGLNIMDGVRLKEILEDHTIWYVLSCRQPQRCKFACKHRVPE